MLDEAKQLHQEEVKRVQMNNAMRYRMAREQFEKQLSAVLAHNHHVSDLRKTFTRRCLEISAENKFRIDRGEEEFQLAWKKFVDKVCFSLSFSGGLCIPRVLLYHATARSLQVAKPVCAASNK